MRANYKLVNVQIWTSQTSILKQHAIFECHSARQRLSVRQYASDEIAAAACHEMRRRAGATPPEVRLAERYVMANLEPQIAQGELAEVAGANTFALFGAFKKYRGCSLLSFLSQARWKGGGPRE
jgi:transcriptional regulator GlxA family with amidase domain